MTRNGQSNIKDKHSHTHTYKYMCTLMRSTTEKKSLYTLHTLVVSFQIGNIFADTLTCERVCVCVYFFFLLWFLSPISSLSLFLSLVYFVPAFAETIALTHIHSSSVSSGEKKKQLTSSNRKMMILFFLAKRAIARAWARDWIHSKYYTLECMYICLLVECWILFETNEVVSFSIHSTVCVCVCRFVFSGRSINVFFYS